jgi:hypothetical protein
MSEPILSDDLEFWRNQKPSQWKMDEFIHKAILLEARINELEEMVVSDKKEAQEA